MGVVLWIVGYLGLVVATILVFAVIPAAFGAYTSCKYLEDLEYVVTLDDPMFPEPEDLDGLD